MKKLNHPSTTVNLEPGILCKSTSDKNHSRGLRRKIIDSFNDYRQVSCLRNRLQDMRTAKQKRKESQENVPCAASMCVVCVITVAVDEGELKIARCSTEISEP